MDVNGEVEVGEWELVHNDDDEPIVAVAAAVNEQLDSNSAVIRPDHFSLNPPIPNSISSCSSNSEVDRNFDDSYVANQLFPNPNSPPSTNLQRWNDSDSDSVSDATTNLPLIDADVAETVQVVSDATTNIPLIDFDVAETVQVGFESKEEEEVEVKEQEGKEVEKGIVRGFVWWKVPFEVLKHWVAPFALPISVPLSVAAVAALLGLFILGRRLRKMKRKTQTLKLNLALDDKKVSQLMGRVAHINEAFSVVSRVPMVRPSLPAPTVTLRSAMSMR